MNLNLKSSSIICLLFICQKYSNGQSTLPDFGNVFYQSEVSVIELYLPSDSLDQMILEESDSHEYECTFQFNNTALADTLQNVAVRLRGNTSLNADKKSFQISFNTFNSGGDWEGVEKINLIGQQNDPSLLRSKLCHDAFRSMGIASARTSFVRLYINDLYRGLYLLQEQIDEEFASLYFDQQGNGNLYKCTYPADLDYLGSSSEDYQFTMWGSRPYDLKTNEWADDYSDFANLVTIINNTSDLNLICELKDVFHLENYLRIAAVDVMCGNWDNYIYNKNNFYLYHNQRTGLFEYIPYDLDNTLGIDWLGEDWAVRDIYEWAPDGAERPLFVRLMENEYARNLFSVYIDELRSNYFDPEDFVSYAESLQEIIMEAALEDPFRTLDFGFDQDAFLNAITDAWGDPHVDYGLADYVESRDIAALFQLEEYTVPSVIVEALYQVEPVYSANSNILIEAVISGSQASDVILEISYDGLSYETAIGFNDSGLDGDATASDGIYTYSAANTTGEQKFYYRLLLPDDSHFPCNPYLLWLTPENPGLFINEVMSNNLAVFADPFGEYNDWLELYNGGTSSVTLSGKYITDNLTDWNKFPLPEVSLDPGEFVIIWLDSDPYQGPFHANFRLDSNDEELWLIGTPNDAVRVVDYFTPCVSLEDNSMERVEDGGSEIAFTDAPTPGSSNEGVSVTEEPFNETNIYPNPAFELINFIQKMDLVELYDASGNLILKESNVTSMDIRKVANGTYILKLHVSNNVHLQSIVVISESE
jgi:spore coat protein H